VIVWDNFESASGIAGTAVTGTLVEQDRAVLAGLLKSLRGGATKVLITSRSEEDWLGSERRWKLPLAGLDGEERWEYCEAIVRDLGLTVNRGDKDFAALMKQLGGHPLAMRVMLPQLEKRSVAKILRALRENLAELKLAAGDEAYEQLFAALRFIERDLPESLRPLLQPLSLHEAFVDLDYLEAMAKGVPGAWTRTQIDQLAGALANAGLLTDRGQAIYELHPALSGYLRSHLGVAAGETEEWNRAFVDVMGSVANSLAPRELHEQRGAFYLHGANFYKALVEAERLAMELAEKALTQSLAVWAQNNRDLVEAERLFLRLARHEDAGSGAYHQLGMVAQERGDFAAAEQWYRKSLTIKEKQGNEHGAAITYHQLGRVALERRDFAAAGQWYRKSLAIEEKQGNEHGAASSYGQLGNLALIQREFVAAEQWYRKSLAVWEKEGSEHNAATTYHQLGVVAEERRDFAAAEQWYLKSLAVWEKEGSEHNAASTYHQLGSVAEEQRDFAAAEQWYRKSLAIKEKLGNEHGAAITYGQLGNLALRQRDFVASEQWYRKSLAVWEKEGNEHGAASTYHQLGMVAEERRDLAAAEEWYRRSLAISEKQGDEHGVASTYHQLGRVEEEQGRQIEAGGLFLRALIVLRKTDPHSAQIAVSGFARIYEAASTDEKAELSALWAQAGLGSYPPAENS